MFATTCKKDLGIFSQPKCNATQDINITGLSLCSMLETATSFSVFVFIWFPAETEETNFFPQAQE